MKNKATVAKYGFMAAPASISLLVMQVYMPTWLSKLGIFSLTSIGFIFFAARLIDTVSDPLIGYLADRQTGRLKGRVFWIAGAIPALLAVSWWLLSPPDSTLFTFLLISAWYIAGTAILIPYYAMGTEIDKGYHSLTSFTGSRAAFGLVATIIALILPTALGVADDLYQSLFATFWLYAPLFLVGVMFLWSIASDKKYTSTESQAPPSQAGLKTYISLFKKGSLFNILIFSQLINGVANAFPATLFLMFAAHVLDAPDAAGPLLMLYFLTAAISIPVWSRLSKKWRKEQCWSAAMIVAGLIFPLTFFVTPDLIWLFAAITFITGLMAGADLTLPASMLGDIINKRGDDDSPGDEATSTRAGSYFAVWGMISKAALALAIGLAFPLLDIDVFTTDTSEAEINKTNLVLLYAMVPSGLKLWSVWLLRKYRLNPA